MKNAIPRPEYPRPQFVRENWTNLNGEWEFRMDNEQSGFAERFESFEHFDDKIIVPFCPESKLSGVEHKNFMLGVWYKRKIDLTENALCGTTYLHIGACDYETHVFINGEPAGRHYGGYSSFSFDITDHLKVGTNDITIFAADDVRSPKQPSGKQCPTLYSCGCSYTRTTGIWQTVWLENVPNAHLKFAKMTPSLQNGTLSVKASTVNCEGLTLSATVRFDGKEIAKAETVCGWRSADLYIRIPEIHPWSIKTPDLYDIEFKVSDDVVKSYFGLRDIAFRDGKFYLNGKSVFQRLILDQGFYPDGIYTAPTDDELIADIRRAQDMGYNGARLHEKVFEPRFLYHCDRLGYLVWGEYPNWGGDCTGTQCYESFLPEWREILERDYSHPSIIGWCPLNETERHINRRFIRTLADFTRSYDPTRLFIDSSGWVHEEGCYDLYDVHDYCGDPATFKAKYDKLIEGEAVPATAWLDGKFHDEELHADIAFMSEFGGIAYKKGENDGGWGYGKSATDEAEFVARYKGLVDAMLDNPKICAFCYTQLTDVEQEQNGLYTYHRVPKVNPEILKEITARKAAVED